LKIEKLVSRSPWLAHFNTAACNGCDIEVLAMLSPNYDPERFGVKLTPSVRHADILVVTGAVNKKAAVRLKRLYDQMAEPKYVVAVGACAITGGVSRNPTTSMREQTRQSQLWLTFRAVLQNQKQFSMALRMF